MEHGVEAFPEHEQDLGGRLQLLRPGDLLPAQQELYGYLLATKLRWAEESKFQGQLADGRMIGPFNGFLQTPEMSRAFNDWVDAEAAHTSLAGDVRQVIVLAVGTAWDAAYEIYAHAAVGRQAGLSEATIQSIIAGHEPHDLSPQAAAAYRFTDALARERSVDDALYAATVAALGTQGVADMVNLIGIYLATSALLNAFRIPVPKHALPLP